MNELQVFSDAEFGQVRSALIDDEPWFVGKDIALALGYSNPQKAIRDHVDEEDRGVNESFTANGTPFTLINESGLYSLILTSKLPSAKQFKRWVTTSVLPAIRKTGMYAAANALDSGDSVVPMRTLTPDDYLAAARLIAGCRADRLRAVLDLLAKGGWDVGPVQQTLTVSTNTADIGPRLIAAREKHSLSRIDLSAKIGIPESVLRSYEAGRRFPKPDRYTMMVAVLNSLDTDEV